MLSKQTYKGHLTDMPILLSFFCRFAFVCFWLLFSLLNFDFTILTFWYILLSISET